METKTEKKNKMHVMARRDTAEGWTHSLSPSYAFAYALIKTIYRDSVEMRRYFWFSGLGRFVV